MSVANDARWRGWFVLFVAAGAVSHVAWEHLHGGVRSHHFLARSDMPSISNWWGLLLLPAGSWFLSGRIRERLRARSTSMQSVLYRFALALLTGAALSVAFSAGQQDVAANVVLGMLVSAFLLRVYRAECVMGFVLAMTWTFGAMLPTLIGGVIAGLSALVHLLVRPAVARLLGKESG